MYIFCSAYIFSERSRSLFAVAYPSVVCLSICRLSVCYLSVTLMCPTQAVHIFGNVSAALCTLAIR